MFVVVRTLLGLNAILGNPGLVHLYRAARDRVMALTKVVVLKAE